MLGRRRGLGTKRGVGRWGLVAWTGFSFTVDIRPRETGSSGRQATDLQEHMYSYWDSLNADRHPWRHWPAWFTLELRVAVWPNRTVENIGAGDWSPLRQTHLTASPGP
jgi:hypothetical protein